MALTDYVQPSLTADVAVFALSAADAGETMAKTAVATVPAEASAGAPGENTRIDKRTVPPSMKVLLIRRGHEPSKGWWALPGGFVNRGEMIAEAAARELMEETGLSGLRLTQLLTFSEPDRDPRGWVVTTLHLATVPVSALATGGIVARPGDDAADARWFEITVTPCATPAATPTGEEEADIYHLELLHTTPNADDTIQLSATVAYFGTGVEPHVLSYEGIAFDHAKMLVYASLAIGQTSGQR
ncbi:MAG: NUDIX hydrolase [Coriobacteriales bacterium]|jgi:ADP-ribose pyrophosphatase YjhB (NUDIX family)|nr:NUDIX hydrolase [Coriobacteriales bacterium]